MNVRLRTDQDTGTQNEVIGAVPVYVRRCTYSTIGDLSIYQLDFWFDNARCAKDNLDYRNIVKGVFHYFEPSIVRELKS